MLTRRKYTKEEKLAIVEEFAKVAEIAAEN